MPVVPLVIAIHISPCAADILRQLTAEGWLRLFTTGSFMVIQLGLSQQPFVADCNVPIAISETSN